MKIILFLALAIQSLTAFADISILSDLDDTIKITNAGSIRAATYNGIAKERVFQGIPEFLSEARSYSNALHVVTASPSLILPDIRETLDKNKIQYESLRYRSVRNWKNSRVFKLGAIKEILDLTTDKLILMGDDVNHDPEIYEEIRQQYPERIAAIYIHVIQGRSLPESSTPYWTSFDLALREFLAGRMNENGVNSVFQSLLNVKKWKYIFPRFAHCPSTLPFEWQLETPFATQAQELISLIGDHCRERGKK